MRVGRPKVKEADPDFSFAAAFIFFTQPSGASVFGRRRPRPLMSKSNRLSESVSVVPGQVAGTGGRRRGICHDRTIHTFDSQGNAIGVGNWVGDFFAHRL